MNIKILYISKYFNSASNGDYGGRGFWLMKGCAEKGHDVTVVTSNSSHLSRPPKLSESSKLEPLPNYKIFWLNNLKYKKAFSIKRVLSWIDFEIKLFFFILKYKEKPDVIIASSLSLLSVVTAFIVSRIYKCRFVFEVRDIWPLTLVEEGNFRSTNIAVRFLSLIEFLGYKKADAIVGTMPNISAHVQERTSRKNGVYCIPMCVGGHAAALSTINVDKNEADTDVLKIIYAGTIGISNVLDVYFEAAKCLEHNLKIRFYVLGSGDMLNAYKSSYGHLKNIEFLPSVSRENVVNELKQFDVAYLSTRNSSIWNYGQSLNKIMDYMLAGRLILASYSGYKSMINEADCGFFVKAECVNSLVSCIEKLSSMPRKVRNQMGQNGRSWLLENRSYKKLANEYIEILKKTIEIR